MCCTVQGSSSWLQRTWSRAYHHHHVQPEHLSCQYIVTAIRSVWNFSTTSVASVQYVSACIMMNKTCGHVHKADRLCSDSILLPICRLWARYCSWPLAHFGGWKRPLLLVPGCHLKSLPLRMRWLLLLLMPLPWRMLMLRASLRQALKTSEQLTIANQLDFLHHSQQSSCQLDVISCIA